MSTQLNIDRGEGNAQRKRFVLLVLIAVAATLLLGAWAWPSVQATQRTPVTDQIGQEAQSSQPAAVATAAASSQTNDVIATTLNPSGFSPTEFSHAAGRFNLRVNNQSGQPKAMLRLNRSGGERMTEVPLTDKVRWVIAAVDLTPGSYTLTVADHASWTCQITIQ